MESFDEQIELIDISSIYIANPRKRNKFIHNEIKENIKTIGLKRPVSVRPVNDENYKYALICGQGRLEAYIEYGETKIPAIIKHVDEETAHLMSLAENIARRNPRAAELMEDIRRMKTSGLTDREIGLRLGYNSSWVNGVITLLSSGEKHLLRAFETGNIPLYLAVEISRSGDEETQELLTTALKDGHIRGGQINKIRRILEQRKKGDKGSINTAFLPGKKQKKLTPEELAGIYQENINEQKAVLLKSIMVKEKILAVKQIFGHLLKSDDFLKLLHRNNIHDVPTLLDDHEKNEGK
ncbi:TPA: ParB/RepB/Spo0J family partition protein [Klebsiella oxytoca]|uniref:ParB/RepB/Spo0J family partition protein n=1 Tax=Klebsiella oxytoca TaxID=571 RepID=UPI000666CCCF|nr:ParB/RepB/Spo0J family partition protein [Klebsiella oxytoca]MBZ7740079.1 ParB/RepB/Spo0J family partition protein [Klebsiella oxytoca]HAV0429311.1 ParB/RepB/Spo0J family partition protein [Klebsiella oxytoca]